MTDRELERRFNAIETRLDRMVTTDTWTTGNDHLKEKIFEVDKDCGERTAALEKATADALRRIEDGKQNAWVRALQIAGIAATLVVAVYTAVKGIK
jgi:hypothetical protein